MNTSSDALECAWEQAVDALRRHKVQPSDAASELRSARREAHARARCLLHLICYISLGIIILAWVTGFRDWMLAQFIDRPVLAWIIVAAVCPFVLALSPLLKPQSLAKIEETIQLRHRRAGQARLDAVAPMISASPGIKEIVSGWMLVLPALRNMDVDELDHLNVIWRQMRCSDATEESKDVLEGYVADGA